MPGAQRDGAVALFQEHIRPVLVSQCLNCHGGQRKRAGLDLSTRDALLLGGDSGPAIVEGKPQDSLLFQLITHEREPAMPRDADKLPAEAIARIAEWIKAGAPYDGPLTAAPTATRPAPTTQPTAASAAAHWGFNAITRPAVPALRNSNWVRNPIDAFVLARLEKEGIAPSPEADRPTLLRRLSLDITGLPPTADELDAFVRDHRPDAYEQRVDRMLASPHYGERWGRLWLDLARYADSDGYEKDIIRPHAWRWRDWVIDALNRDMPFDQFTVEQLAGDLLPDAHLEQKVATGFHRNTLTNTEGGVDQEEYRCRAVVDRVNTTGAVWLGLTVGCAECHSHKYDPISQREYYGMFAFFNSSDEQNIPAPLPEDASEYEKARKAFEVEEARLKAELARFEKEVFPARQAAWEKEHAAQAGAWTVLRPVLASSSAGASLTIRKDGSILAGGKTPDADTYVIVARTELTGITAVRLEVLTDKSLPSKGPGRVGHGNFVLSQIRLLTGTPDEPGRQTQVRLTRSLADFEQADYGVAAALDDDPETGWAIAPQMSRNHVAVFETAEDVGGPGGTTLTFVLDQHYGDQHVIGKFRFSATSARRPVQLDSTPPEVATILALSDGQRTKDQQATLAAHYRSIDPERLKLQAAIDEQAKQAPPTPLAQVLLERSKPRPTYIHVRGDFLRHGDQVTPHTPAVLPALRARGQLPDRLDLARWLMDPANPLTARVAINRIWQQLFGRGIVATPNDFGTRGDPPSHPELLDWLATEFIERGWRQKELIKLIATSATYRQSSRVQPELLERDPKNILLARQSRLRMEAEIIRDETLAVSGLLNAKIGGPSIRPPLPGDLAKLGYADSVQWVESPGAEKYRRGMYIFFQRTVPYPMLLTFDGPDGIVTCTRRERSNTPLQSLTLLNDPVFFECAQSLARQSVEAGDTLDAGVRRLFRVCLGREPSAGETRRLAEFWREMASLCRSDATAARAMIGSLETEVQAGALPDAAAWVATARTILNLDEFVTRE